MQTTASAPLSGTKLIAATTPWLMLLSRSLLFILAQVLIALIVSAAGAPNPWDESTRYWGLIAAAANIASLYLLVRVYKAEGKRFWDSLRFSRETWKADLLWFILASIIAMPIVGAPREPLANAIFGDAMIATNMLFRPIPTWAFVLSFLFPLTIAFAELPTYFAYVMPRLSQQINGWLAWIIASFFLAAQHMFLPFIFDGGYLLWRFGMFLPFALFAGLVIKLRPALLPYFVIVHALLDVTTVLVYLMI
jgi:membrane protease YdiL (CAAX protease family)